MVQDSEALMAVMFSANQRKVDLLFRRLAWLEDVVPPDGNVTYASLCKLLRDKQLLDFPEQFLNRGWIVSPLEEVRLLEILHQCWRDQPSEAEIKELKTAREGLQMDTFNRNQICTALASIASECMTSYDPHAMFHSNEKDESFTARNIIITEIFTLAVIKQVAGIQPSTNQMRINILTPQHTRPKTVAEGFLDEWRNSNTFSEVRPHSAGVPRRIPVSPVAKRPASHYSNRLGATSTPTSLAWGGSRRELSSSTGSGGEREWEEPSKESRNIKAVPAKLPAWAFASVGKQAIRDAIEIINPHDTSWQISPQTLRAFLEQRMKLTPTTCNLLREGNLEQMFVDTDLDGDGLVTLEELASYLAAPPRFKRNRHGPAWKEVISMACSVRLAKHHHSPNVYLYPSIEVYCEAPPDRNPIYAQFQRPSNYPPHCGYGPVSRGEYKLEQNAGMLSRSIAWEKTAGYPHRLRIGKRHTTSTTPTIVHPLETPSMTSPYVSPSDMGRMSRPNSMASRIGTPLQSRPTTSSSRATKQSRLSSAAPNSRRGVRSHGMQTPSSRLHTPNKDNLPGHRLGSPLTEPAIQEDAQEAIADASA